MGEFKRPEWVLGTNFLRSRGQGWQAPLGEVQSGGQDLELQGHRASRGFPLLTALGEWIVVVRLL